MRPLTARTIRHAVAATTLAAAAALAAAPAAMADHASDFHHAFTLGLRGYTYGEPLMNIQRVFKSETSVTVPDDRRTRQPPAPASAHLDEPRLDTRVASGEPRSRLAYRSSARPITVSG